METIEEKIKRIKKFGMREFETLDSGHEVKILMAQINHLKNNNKILTQSLDYISSSVSDIEEARALAETALSMTQVREWRRND